MGLGTVVKLFLSMMPLARVHVLAAADDAGTCDGDSEECAPAKRGQAMLQMKHVQQQVMEDVDKLEEAGGGNFTLSVVLLSPEEFTRHRLSIPSLYSSAALVEGHFPSVRTVHGPPWRAASLAEAAGATETSFDPEELKKKLEELKKKFADVVKPAELKRKLESELEKLVQSKTPTHHASGCFEARIGLESLGYPGLSVLLGVEGMIGADAKKCLSWDFRVLLGFEYAIKVFGHGVMARVMVKGGVKLMETPCKDAAASDFCKYLPLFLPKERGDSESHQTQCLTNSAFEVLQAYLDSSWQSVKSAFGIADSLGKSINTEMRMVETLLSVYPSVLTPSSPVSAPALPAPAQWHVQNWRTFFDSAVRYVWFPEGARRLCLSKTKPVGKYPAGLRPAFTLREECSHSLSFDEIEKVERNGNELHVGARGGRTLRLESTSWSQKSSKADALRRVLLYSVYAAESPSERGVGVQCMSASLTNELKYPYCMVETFAQSFATRVSMKDSGGGMKDPSWAETFGLNVRGYEDLSVSIADVQREGQAVGSATLRVCASKNRIDKTEWDTISSFRACESNGDGISRMAQVARASGDAECKLWCERTPGCTAVDYFGQGGRCNLYKAPCSSPKTYNSGSRSYKMKKRKCDHVLPADGQSAQGSWVLRSLVVLKQQGWWTKYYAPQKVGSVKVRLELPATQISEAQAKALPNLPTLRKDAQALFLAFEQWRDKLPDYSKAVEISMAGTNDDDTGINYRYLNGRFMARWPTWEQRKAMDGHGKPEPKKEQESWWKKAGSAANSWFMGAGNWFRNIADHRPCVEGPLSDASQHDHRVLDFPRALRESISAGHVGRHVDFHAEVASSLGNLFVRIVQDIHALFGMYFASDAAWDGECASLPAWHQLPYEFGANSGVPPADFAWSAPETRPPKEARFHILRRADGVAGVKGNEMGDLFNPLCEHAWVSNLRGQENRADFAAMDAPLGNSTRRAPPQSQATAVHGHVWCNLVKHTREAWQAVLEGGGPDHPFKGQEYDDGLRLEFRSACKQVTSLDGSDDSLWQRYECESALLSAAFVTIFPSMTQWMQEQFRVVGQAMEDVLQCTGRISPSTRQFPASSRSIYGFSAKDCTGKADFVQLVNEGRGLTRDGTRRWEVLSGNRACEQNPDGVERISFLQGTSGLTECQSRCEEDPTCQAVDYFRTGWCNFYSRPCSTPAAPHDGASSYVMKRATTRPSSKHTLLVAYVEDRTQAVMRTVSDLAKRFGSEEARQRATQDFYEAFSYEDWGRGMGPHFTGAMYKGGLQKVQAELGSDAAVKKYLEYVKGHLIMKAWQVRKGMGAVNVFPPPTRTETSVAISTEASWGALKDGPFFCTSQDAQQVAVEAAWAAEGKTWQEPTAEGDLRFGKPCIRMRLAPVDNLLVDASLCIAQRRKGGGMYDWDTAWQVGATSVLSSSPQVELKEKLRQGITEKIDSVHTLLDAEAGEGTVPLDMSEVRGLVSNAAWQAVNSILSDPKFLEDALDTLFKTRDLSQAFKVGGKPLLDSLKTAGMKLANTLKARLAAKVLQMLPNIRTWIDKVFKSPWSLSQGKHNILSGNLALRKIGSAPWKTDYKIAFSRLMETNLSMPLPTSSIAASFCRTEDFDVTDVLQTMNWSSILPV